MTWKKTNNSDAGTATKFGGNDIDKISDAFNGVDVSDPIIFRTDFNTIRDSTNAAGDMLVGNGTKLARRARGTASQVWRTNAAGTDTEWATLAAGGDITAGANVGSGTGQVFRDKTTTTLNFKTLLAGTNITLTNNANDVTIAASGAGGGGDVTGAANVGSGTGTIFRDEVTGVLNLKTILAGTGITVTNNANDITLASTGGGSTTLDGLTDVAITSAARGDVIVRDATQYINKAKGTANQVLAMDGTGTDPVWTTLAAGGIVNWQDYAEQASAPANPSTDQARVYMRDIDTNNQGLFVKIKKGGAFVEVQIC